MFLSIRYLLHNSQTTKITDAEITNFHLKQIYYKCMNLGAGYEAQKLLKNKEKKVLKTKYLM